MLRFGLFLTVLLAVPWQGTAAAPELHGDLIQGGLVLGKVPPGSSVKFEGERIRVSPQGDFLIGFSRDADPESTLEVTYPDGARERQTLKVAQREYKVQRIDGLPPRKVTPDPEDMERSPHRLYGCLYLAGIGSDLGGIWQSAGLERQTQAPSLRCGCRRPGRGTGARAGARCGVAGAPGHVFYRRYGDG